MVKTEATPMIIRFDDISPNTYLFGLSEMAHYLTETIEGVELWFAVNVLSKACVEGSVYPGVPFKNKPKQFFYSVNLFRNSPMLPGRIVSHGLLHADHSRLSYDAQELSILTSCNLITANVFVPPFNRWNKDTEKVCQKNSIVLVKDPNWRNLEIHDFDPSHPLWYLHPWRWDVTKLKEKISAGKNMGQLQANSAASAR